MSLQSKINQRMDILQDWMEQDYHLAKPSYLDTFSWTGYKNNIPEEVIL